MNVFFVFLFKRISQEVSFNVNLPQVTVVSVYVMECYPDVLCHETRIIG